MRALETALRNAEVWYPSRGYVCWVLLDKLRPGVIISIDQLNRTALDVCIVPTTGEHHGNFPMRVELTKADGLPEQCWAKCDQVTTVLKLDVKSLITKLPAEKFKLIETQVRRCLGL
jgi:mRNA-degrading endonuclease toxin of MazEF toxin-antitoxin module